MNDFDLGLLVLRLVVGGIFAAHGAQKAFGWWSGPGIDGWQGVLANMGFRPTPFWAAVSIGAELIGGLALVIGFLAPLAATVVIGQATVIIIKAHWPRGFWNGKGGIEFPLSLGGSAVAIALMGAGQISVDSLLGITFADWFRVALVGVGLVGGLVSLTLARPHEATAAA